MIMLYSKNEQFIKRIVLFKLIFHNSITKGSNLMCLFLLCFSCRVISAILHRRHAQATSVARYHNALCKNRYRSNLVKASLPWNPSSLPFRMSIKGDKNIKNMMNICSDVCVSTIFSNHYIQLLIKISIIAKCDAPLNQKW